MPMSEFDMQTKELNNGRLAMIAVAAFTVQVGFTSQVFVSFLSHVKDKLSAYAGQWRAIAAHRVTLAMIDSLSCTYLVCCDAEPACCNCLD